MSDETGTTDSKQAMRDALADIEREERAEHATTANRDAMKEARDAQSSQVKTQLDAIFAMTTTEVAKREKRTAAASAGKTSHDEYKRDIGKLGIELARAADARVLGQFFKGTK